MKKDSFIAKPTPFKQPTEPHVQPLYMSSSYRFKNLEEGIEIFTGQKEGHVYGRYGNPNVEACASKIAELEVMGLEKKAHGVMVSSGMAAISTLIDALLQAGDTIISPPNLYGGTTELLNKVIAKQGIEIIYSSFENVDELEDRMKQASGQILVLFETPTNPTLSVVDLKAVAEVCQKNKAISVVDNTFMTPYLQQPFAFGIDYIIHSTTKYINGHGNSIAGVIIGTDLKAMKELVWTSMKLLGTNCSPWEAWLTSQGIKTLALRMDKQCENAMEIATYLENHPKVNQVFYPGLSSFKGHEIAKKQMLKYGAMLSFEVDGGIENAKKVMNHFQFISIAPTLGDLDTLALHPATMSHLNIAKEIRLSQNITDGLIRLSIGIENISDIKNDLEKALSSTS